MSAPLAPFLFLSCSFSTNESLSSLQPHHGACAHVTSYSCIGQKDLAAKGWSPEAQGLRFDAGEAVGAVQLGTAWEVPAGRLSAGSQKDGSAKDPWPTPKE